MHFMILQSSHHTVHIICVLIFNKFSHFPGRLSRRHFIALCCVPMDNKTPEFIFCIVALSQPQCTCDGYGGRNKNNHVVHTVTHLLRQSAPKSIQNVLIFFPEREYKTIYSQVVNVHALVKDWKLHDVKSLSKVFQNVHCISSCKRIFIEKHETKRSSVIMCIRAMTHYKFDPDTDPAVPILKHGKIIPDVIPEISTVYKITEQKKQDAQSLLSIQFGEDCHGEKDFHWYKGILDSGSERTDVQNVSDDVPFCSCVEDEPRIH
ncbi:hypothetical protein PR048_011722, partial [Dryococelus australis]